MQGFILILLMAWTVDDIKKKMLFLSRGNQSGSNVEDCINAWNIEQHLLHTDLIGRWQSMANGKSGMNTGLIQNETIITELSPFIKPLPITIASGNAPKPSDFSFTMALKKGGKHIHPTTHDRVSSILDSVIDPPSTTDNKYYYVEYQNYYYLIPHTVTGTVDLDYVCNPTDIVWNFTLDGNNRKVYSVSGSVQPQWLQNEIVLITKRALSQLGISFKDSDFSNAGMMAKTTGE